MSIADVLKKEGFEKGIEEGIERGMEKGKSELAWKLLIKKFPKIDSNYYERIKHLDPGKIDMISIELFDMKNMEELDKYL